MPIVMFAIRNSQFAILVLFAQDEGPGLFRMLGPLLIIIGITVFGWINEKIKKKERQQQAEQEEDYRREDQEAMDRRAGSAQPPSQPVQQPQRPRPAEPIQRYQPQIPSPPPAPSDWRRPRAQESEQIVLAEDITVTAARRLRRQHLRAQAQQRAKALQAQRRQQAAELKARQAAQKAAAQRETSRALHDGDVSSAQPVVPAPSGTLPSLDITVSHAQLRQAVVWAEILGPPRALREYSPCY